MYILSRYKYPQACIFALCVDEMPLYHVLCFSNSVLSTFMSHSYRERVLLMVQTKVHSSMYNLANEYLMSGYVMSSKRGSF